MKESCISDEEMEKFTLGSVIAERLVEPSKQLKKNN